MKTRGRAWRSQGTGLIQGLLVGELSRRNKRLIRLEGAKNVTEKSLLFAVSPFAAKNKRSCQSNLNMTRTPQAALGMKVIFCCLKREEILFYFQIHFQFKVLSSCSFLKLEIQFFDQLESCCGTVFPDSPKTGRQPSPQHSCDLSKRSEFKLW